MGDSGTKRITNRELQVLRLICEGYSTKRIAAELGVTFKTAATHRSHLLEKADVHGVVLLLRWAIRNGIVEQ